MLTFMGAVYLLVPKMIAWMMMWIRADKLVQGADSCGTTALWYDVSEP